MAEAASAAVVRLSAGTLEVGLSPLKGGAIQWFDDIAEGQRRPLLRGSNTFLENVLDAASFPLVPFVNRIRGGSFDFRGKAVRLAPNMAGDPSPLHGQGWLAAWRADLVRENEARLSFEHDAGEWPWAYDAAQHFLLDDSGLEVRLICANRSAEPMPCGLGQHPYFHCGPNTRIQTEVDHAWTIDEQVLPVERVRAAGRFDLSDRPVCGQGLDHGFGGWGGSARLTDPAWPGDLIMSSPTARFFQLYSPASGGLCVVEPVTHANAALNAPEEEWGELGLRVLEPGESMELVMRLELEPR